MHSRWGTKICTRLLWYIIMEQLYEKKKCVIDLDIGKNRKLPKLKHYILALDSCFPIAEAAIPESQRKG